jgi:hypothetical protein
MTEPRPAFDLTQFEADLGSAAGALQAFARGPAQQAADSVSRSFERAGDRIARALGQAALSGEGAFRRLAQTLLEELARVAMDRVFAVARPAQSAPGAKAPAPGARAGADKIAAAPVAVHVHLGAGADPAAILRHQGQIAAAVARAVAYGRRNL